MEAVRQRIGWNDQKREEIIRSQPPSPSHIIKTLKKEAKAKGIAPIPLPALARPLRLFVCDWLTIDGT